MFLALVSRRKRCPAAFTCPYYAGNRTPVEGRIEQHSKVNRRKGVDNHVEEGMKELLALRTFNGVEFETGFPAFSKLHN
jgi:hypothetical protein